MYDTDAEYAKMRAEFERLNADNKKLLAERNELMNKKQFLADALTTLHKDPRVANQVKEVLSQKGIAPLPKSPYELEADLQATKEEMKRLQFQLQLKEDYEKKMGANQKYGLMPDEETVDAVTRYMIDNNIASYESAAKFYKNEMLSTKKSPVDDTYEAIGNAFKGGNNDIFGASNVNDIARQAAAETAEEYKKIMRMR
jgi:hypothetical protein